MCEIQVSPNLSTSQTYIEKDRAIYTKNYYLYYLY